MLWYDPVKYIGLCCCIYWGAGIWESGWKQRGSWFLGTNQQRHTSECSEWDEESIWLSWARHLKQMQLFLLPCSNLSSLVEVSHNPNVICLILSRPQSDNYGIGSLVTKTLAWISELKPKVWVSAIQGHINDMQKSHRLGGPSRDSEALQMYNWL